MPRQGQAAGVSLVPREKQRAELHKPPPALRGQDEPERDKRSAECRGVPWLSHGPLGSCVRQGLSCVERAPRILGTIVSKLSAHANNKPPENITGRVTVTGLQRSADYYGKKLQLWEALSTIKALST